LREQFSKRVAQPFDGAPIHPEVLRHLVQGEAGARCGQHEGEAEQAL